MALGQFLYSLLRSGEAYPRPTMKMIWNTSEWQGTKAVQVVSLVDSFSAWLCTPKVLTLAEHGGLAESMNWSSGPALVLCGTQLNQSNTVLCAGTTVFRTRLQHGCFLQPKPPGQTSLKVSSSKWPVWHNGVKDIISVGKSIFWLGPNLTSWL